MQRRIILLIIVLGLAIPQILESLAADPAGAPNLNAAPPASNLARGISLSTMSEEQAAKLSPLNREIRALLVKEREDVARLTLSMNSIQDPIAALTAQREISELKTTTQISILEVQGRYAQEEGRTELAEEIDAVVARMKDRQEARATSRSER